MAADLDPDAPGGWPAQLRFGADGLITAIAQEHGSGRILMVATMNREAVAETVRRGEAVYWSRSRGKLWHKGEASGNVQRVLEIRTDCDGDVLLLTVEQGGGVACHTGRHSCFFHRLDGDRWQAVDPVLVDPATLYPGKPGAEAGAAADRPAAAGAAGVPAGMAAPLSAATSPTAASPATADAVLARVADVLESRRGADPDQSYVARLYARGDDAILKKIGEEATETVLAVKDGIDERIIAETADLWFHTLVMLAHRGLRPEDVTAELARREGLSGLVEKALRKTRD